MSRTARREPEAFFVNLDVTPQGKKSGKGRAESVENSDEKREPDPKRVFFVPMKKSPPQKGGNNQQPLVTGSDGPYGSDATPVAKQKRPAEVARFLRKMETKYRLEAVNALLSLGLHSYQQMTGGEADILQLAHTAHQIRKLPSFHYANGGDGHEYASKSAAIGPVEVRGRKQQQRAEYRTGRLPGQYPTHRCSSAPARDGGGRSSSAGLRQFLDDERAKRKEEGRDRSKSPTVEIQDKPEQKEKVAQRQEELQRKREKRAAQQQQQQHQDARRGSDINDAENNAEDDDLDMPPHIRKNMARTSTMNPTSAPSAASKPSTAIDNPSATREPQHHQPPQGSAIYKKRASTSENSQSNSVKSGANSATEIPDPDLVPSGMGMNMTVGEEFAPPTSTGSSQALRQQSSSTWTVNSQTSSTVQSTPTQGARGSSTTSAQSGQSGGGIGGLNAVEAVMQSTTEPDQNVCPGAVSGGVVHFPLSFVEDLHRVVKAMNGVRASPIIVSTQLQKQHANLVQRSGFDNLYRSALINYHVRAGMEW